MANISAAETQAQNPTPITIITGFLGSGKTTLMLNLLPQLPKDYKLALLKNEFGDIAIDSELASKSSISGVRELLNGCICCNLVGQLGDALKALRAGSVLAAEGGPHGSNPPDRIVIETSGSAFPATLAMEVNRLAAETGAFSLDGVVSVIDIENWNGYEDTSVTAKMQARYTDMIVLNKWEEAGERKLDDVLDRLGDLEAETPRVKTDRGRVEKEALLGIDGALARHLNVKLEEENKHLHEHHDTHQSEVEVLSATLLSPSSETVRHGVDLEKFEAEILSVAPKDEVYRIKGILWSASKIDPSHMASPGLLPVSLEADDEAFLRKYILNFAFGRWGYTFLTDCKTTDMVPEDPLARLTFVTAPYESNKWKKKLENSLCVNLSRNPANSVSPDPDTVSQSELLHMGRVS